MSNKFRRILDQSKGATTLIATDTIVEGTIAGSDNLVVCGRVTGDCDVPNSVTVAQGGHWKGRIKANNVILAGKVEGDVLAAQQIEVSSTANVAGTLTGGSIAIAEGAILEGDIKISGGQPPRHFVEKRSGRTSDED